MTAFPEHHTWVEHRVSYGETDAMGLVYYGNYLHYFERGRSHFIRQWGISYREFEARGLFLPVREASVRYRAPARYDDLIWIHSGLAELGRASLRFIYEVFDEQRQTLLATGQTQHACVNDEGRPIKTPRWLIDLFS